MTLWFWGCAVAVRWDESALKWSVSPRHADHVQPTTSGRGKRNELAQAGGLDSGSNQTKSQAGLLNGAGSWDDKILFH